MAVHDHGSVVAAAAELGFTPSAVSQQIKRLGRQSRSPVLERVENLPAAPGPLTGSFRLASFSSACRGLVAPLLARLQVSAPELEVTLLENDPRESVVIVVIVVIVERGGADLALVHDWNTLPLNIPPSLPLVPLFADQADVLLPADHPLAGRDELETTDLTGERWVSTHPGSICHEWLVQMFAAHGTRPDIRFHDADYSTHAALVSHGVAVALMPRLGRVLLPPDVRLVPVVNPTPRRQVGSLWRRASTENQARQHVQTKLEKLVADTATRRATRPPECHESRPAAASA
ncbi:MAG: LysR family transcriptional regulator [Flavobacterium sp.]|nr:LysR family transcriptional regulator [Aeromicrobium sp.]